MNSAASGFRSISASFTIGKRKWPFGIGFRFLVPLLLATYIIIGPSKSSWSHGQDSYRTAHFVRGSIPLDFHKCTGEIGGWCTVNQLRMSGKKGPNVCRRGNITDVRLLRTSSGTTPPFSHHNTAFIGGFLIAPKTSFINERHIVLDSEYNDINHGPLPFQEAIKHLMIGGLQICHSCIGGFLNDRFNLTNTLLNAPSLVEHGDHLIGDSISQSIRRQECVTRLGYFASMNWLDRHMPPCTHDQTINGESYFAGFANKGNFCSPHIAGQEDKQNADNPRYLRIVPIGIHGAESVYADPENGGIIFDLGTFEIDVSSDAVHWRRLSGPHKD